jgi:hypothetical protein
MVAKQMNGCSPCTEERLDSVEELGKRVAGCQSGLRSSASSDLALLWHAVHAGVKNREQSKKGVRKRPTQRSTNTQTYPSLCASSTAPVVYGKVYGVCAIGRALLFALARGWFSCSCLFTRTRVCFGAAPCHIPPECTTGQKPLGTTICCSTLSFTASL